MSYQITLNTWSGDDKAEAAEKLAKGFRFRNEKAMTVVDSLCQGLPWRFDRRVPDHQADMASTYLRGLGFAADIQPVEGEIELLPDSVATAEVAVKEESDISTQKDGYRFKFLGDAGTFHFLWVVGEDVPDYEEWCKAHH